MLAKIYKVGLLIFIISELTACASTASDIGIPEDQWQKYDKTRQEQLLKDYAALEEANKQEDQSTQSQYDSLKDETYSGDYLRVNIYSGQVMMPPFTDWYPFKKIGFDVIPDTCTSVILEEDISGEEDSKPKQVSLRACFKNSVLFLDPSRYDASQNQGTVRFVSSPLWEMGFVYKNINSHGYVKLKDVSVEIKNKVM
jgi:hypothetical protein